MQNTYFISCHLSFNFSSGQIFKDVSLSLYLDFTIFVFSIIKIIFKKQKEKQVL